MFSLATEKNQKTLKKREFTFLLASMFCALFGVVYEQFSHGVYSYYMLYAFAIPLVGGTFVTFLVDFSSSWTMPGKTAFFLYASGIATLSVGSIFNGVLEIYGTTNSKVIFYPIVGLGMSLSGVAAYLIGCMRMRREIRI